ncbi:MAG: class I mannose-6-phosphate isomerase [Flavobacteriaceae bacterium]|nr:class I mannose-6-phosphate isomerase [Flavobacteriaceae bacterium]
MKLYPLVFTPIIKARIWGGTALHQTFNKSDIGEAAGESWEISGVEGDVSVVANGPLEGKDLKELIQDYGKDLMGSSVIRKFGTEFPILIKFIDAQKDLSIQVHPDDMLAEKRHGGKGKTEMWYIMKSEPGARLLLGFNKHYTPTHYEEHLNNNTLLEILHQEAVGKGQAYFIKAGTVHAIGAGIVLAEIQQTSDITYRVYDYDRVDTTGNTRELHTELALEAIDFEPATDARLVYEKRQNQSSPLVDSPYFKTNILPVDGSVKLDLHSRDSFTILMAVEGEISISHNAYFVELAAGSTCLIPASLASIRLEGKGELLEITL